MAQLQRVQFQQGELCVERGQLGQAGLHLGLAAGALLAPRPGAGQGLLQGQT